MMLYRFFHSDAINWNALPELAARLARHNFTLQKASVTLNNYPDAIGPCDRVAAI
jgi:hypothetical protein